MPAVSRNDNGETVPAWFRGMDSNGDGDISPREFLGSSDKFRQLDADGDGFVSGDEAKRIESHSRS
jgi:Ca2+-binding EF-hand superfamily protein